MNLATDGRILWRLLRGQPRHGTPAERLAAFYGPQATTYDAFRERLLHGRAELLLELAARLPGHARLVELGGGTGRNLAFLGARLADFARVEVVDLCPPLLDQARRRWRAWPNVVAVEADATRYRPSQPVDAVVLAYALTMIPDWFLAVDNALAMLAPGGLLGVVDFYVARRSPAPGRARHSALARHGWPAWFGHDGVHPSPDHLPYLEAHSTCVHLREGRAPLPYLPGLRVPYYVYLGRKPDPAAA